MTVSPINPVFLNSNPAPQNEKGKTMKHMLFVAKKFAESSLDADIISIQLYFIRDTIGEVANIFPKYLSDIRDLLSRDELKVENYRPYKPNFPIPETAQDILVKCGKKRTCGFHIRHRIMAMNHSGYHRRRYTALFDPAITCNSELDRNHFRHTYRKRANVCNVEPSSIRFPSISYTFLLLDFHSDWLLPPTFLPYISRLEYYTRYLDKWFLVYDNIRKFFHLDSTDEPLLQFESFVYKKLAEAIEKVSEADRKVQTMILERANVYHQMIAWPEIEDCRVAADHNSVNLWQALHQWLEVLEICFDKIIGIFLQYLGPILDSIQVQRINRVSETKSMT